MSEVKVRMMMIPPQNFVASATSLDVATTPQPLPDGQSPVLFDTALAYRGGSLFGLWSGDLGMDESGLLDSPLLAWLRARDDWQRVRQSTLPWTAQSILSLCRVLVVDSPSAWEALRRAQNIAEGDSFITALNLLAVWTRWGAAAIRFDWSPAEALIPPGCTFWLKPDRLRLHSTVGWWAFVQGGES